MRCHVGVFGVMALMAPMALAQVTQPNGLVVPRDSMNGEVQLYTLFSGRGEGVDWVNDAHPVPATFSPLCSFSATFVLNESAWRLGLAWYNATGTAPAPADLHIIVPAGSPVGTVITSTSIRGDTAYAGGLVGFALVGEQTHYSEVQWNPVCTACTTPGPWYMALMYQSTTTPNAYYIGFEDGAVGSGPGDFSNDGDYNDDVFFVTGITCSGAGVECPTGMPGVCAAGAMQCTPEGTLECQPLVRPSMERCNGLDDDCNSMTDEGDLCPMDFVCDHGTCVHACGTGEFNCPTGLACNADGYCVDMRCVGVSCPTGSVCHGGTCRAPCDGVTCPHPLVCRVDVCVDPCDGLTCPMGQVCDAGICKENCTCAACESGTMCEASSGLCREASCVDHGCAAGTHCEGGTCVDNCTGASCPPGEVCRMGGCVADPCNGITCPGGQVCREGACVDPCAGVTCPAGQICRGGTCEADPCTGITCGAGMHCELGICRGDVADGGTRFDGGGGGTLTGGCCAVAKVRGDRGLVLIGIVLAIVWARRRRK